MRRVKAARWFTIVSDEVTDVSNREQLTLVLRYVDMESLTIREDLVGFVECNEGITGQALAANITKSLEQFGLDLNNIRGQAYDGAGNMSGSTNGAAAIIRRQHPQALYLHCASHCLNLAVVKSLQVTSVQNMMECLGRVYRFFAAHPKRQRALEEAISSCSPATRVTKLKDMCRTRWVQRIDAIQIFLLLHHSIITCMERICSDGAKLWSNDSLTDARALQLLLSTTDFVCALVITDNCLRYIEALTTNLQAEAKDIVCAVKEVTVVTATVQKVRNEVEQFHAKWFDKIKKLCEDSGIVLSLPRRCGRQIHRANTPADTPCEYYRRTITIPLLDHMLTELNSRFGQHQQTALLGLSILPSILVTLSAEKSDDTIVQLCQQYSHSNDLPSPHCLESELHSWRLKWQQQLAEHGEKSLPRTLAQTLRQISSMYPNISAMVRLLATLPVTTCSAERSFSSLKRIKTAFRATMTTTRLSGLTLLHVHLDIPVNVDSAVDEFARRHPRRIKMVDILSEAQD